MKSQRKVVKSRQNSSSLVRLPAGARPSSASVLFREVRQLHMFCLSRLLRSAPHLQYCNYKCLPSFVLFDFCGNHKTGVILKSVFIHKPCLCCVYVLIAVVLLLDCIVFVLDLDGSYLYHTCIPQIPVCDRETRLKRWKENRETETRLRRKTGIGKTAAPSLARCPNRREMEIYKNR